MTLDDQLRAWGAAEAQAVGAHPPLALHQPRRRRLPLTAGAALTAAAAGIVVTLFVVGSHHNPAETTLAASPTGVPWADLPARTISPVPATPADLSVRACQAADLTANNGEGNGAGGWSTLGIELRNGSNTGCRMPVHLDSIGAVHRGRPTTLPVAGSAVRPHGPAQPVLMPGQSGGLIVSYYARCDSAPLTIPDASYSHLRLRLAGGEVALPNTEHSIYLGCAKPESAIGAQFSGPEQPDPVPMAANVTLTVPSSVRAGSVLHYTVTLRPKAGALTLDPCPNFLQTLLAAQQKQRHALNCAAAQRIPAGGAETFNMELLVPATSVLGPATLTWSSFDGVEGDSTATVNITA